MCSLTLECVLLLQLDMKLLKKREALVRKGSKVEKVKLSKAIVQVSIFFFSFSLKTISRIEKVKLSKTIVQVCVFHVFQLCSFFEQGRKGRAPNAKPHALDPTLNPKP